MTKDGFVEISHSIENIDRYCVRSSILTAIQCNVESFSGRMLDAGCGKMPYREYILSHGKVKEYVGLDIEGALKYDVGVRPDFTWDGKVMPFENATFECCMATEVLEHCPEPEVFLKEVNRVLRNGGVFFFTVPFLWNLHEVPHDEYRYTPFSLQRHLQNSGFIDVEVKATGGWHAAMAQMMGLWVRRSGLNRYTKALLSYTFRPLMKFLLHLDRRKPVLFKEGVMITGLYGTARKAS